MKFQGPEAFAGTGGYDLLPFRFRRLPFARTRAVVSNLAGDWLTCNHDDLAALIKCMVRLDRRCVRPGQPSAQRRQRLCSPAHRELR